MSLSVHHAYDSLTKTLYLGNGSRRVTENIDLIVKTVAGTGSPGYTGDEVQADKVRLNYPEDVEISSDGSLYIADRNNHRIRRVGSDGIITTVAGNGSGGYSGDGGQATEARLNRPNGIALGSDGSLYIADTN